MVGRMTMKAWLEGHRLDLRDLDNLLPSGDVRVIREGDAYDLTAPAIDNPPEGTTFYETAQRVIDHINGLARVKNPNLQPAGLSGKYTDGESQHTVGQPYVSRSPHGNGDANGDSRRYGCPRATVTVARPVGAGGYTPRSRGSARNHPPSRTARMGRSLETV